MKNDLLKIQNNIKKFIFKKKNFKNILNKDIFKSKDIDSVSIIKLIIFLESKYKIKLNDNEIFSKNFKTIRGISKIIISKLN